MCLVIPIFVGGGEGGSGLLNFWGGGVVKKRESPDFRSPEVGISVDGKATLPVFSLIDVKLMFRRVPAVVSTIKRKKMTELTKDTKHNRQDESTRPSLHRCKFTDRYLRFSRRFPLLGISSFLIALNNRKKHTIKP